MKSFLDHLVWMFGGICLIVFLIEYPFSLYQGTEFALPARSFITYLLFSAVYASYQLIKARKANEQQAAETA